MKKLILFTLSILIVSCAEPDFQETSNLENLIIKNRMDIQDSYELKKKFALALHAAMTDYVELRDFIKREALKEFNGDFDILYNYVKSERVGDYTFRGLLLNYFDSEEELDQIEYSIPSLTIFVPELPNDSFSANLWETESEIPLVAIRLVEYDKTPIISSNSDSFLLDHDMVPGFPIVVIKENERITTPDNSGYSLNDTREYSSSNGFKFKFIDSYFNNITGEYVSRRNKRRNKTISNAPKFLVDAWELYGQYQNLGWHRDYIYYGLQPQVDEGPYINDYSEHFSNFRIEGSTGMDALSKISQPSSVTTQFTDPLLNTNWIAGTSNGPNQASFWTDGKFDFNVITDYEQNTTPLSKFFDARPEDLFTIIYEPHSINGFVGWWFYRVVDVEQKAMPLNLEIRPWSLHSIANEWRFRVFEVDANVNNTYTTQNAYKRNTNFQFTDKKIGWQFGASNETTNTQTKQVVFKEESNDLGDADVFFGDNVIIDLNQINTWFFTINNYQLRRYTSGSYSFSLIPLKVQ